MADSYTVFWPNRRCRTLERYGLGGRLTVLFGGPHVSQPNFRRAGVKDGDHLYPVRVLDGRLYVLGRMRVRQLISLDHPETPASLEDYLQRFPEWRWLPQTCTNEVVIGQDGTPLRLDLAVPPDLLRRLTFRSRRRERTLKHIQDGRLTHAISLQGIYRLSEPSAAELAALLTRAPATRSPATRPPARRRRLPAVSPDQLRLFR
jgi:hypothetical protein